MKNKILIKNGIKGFTLIELLVVIAIIGLLSSVVLASLNSARIKAQISKAKMEMTQIVKAITIAQGESGNYLGNITVSWYSGSACLAATDYRNIIDTNLCYTRLVLALTKIETATNGLMIGISNITRDPWGSPYHLDENEGEGGSGCGYDTLLSLGPDGIKGTGDEINSVRIPHIKCP